MSDNFLVAVAGYFVYDKNILSVIDMFLQQILNGLKLVSTCHFRFFYYNHIGGGHVYQ